MKVILYNSNAEKVRINKDAYISAILSLDGTLRNECSVITPTIIFEISAVKYIKDDADEYVTSNSTRVIYNIIEKLVGCNYAYIKEFNRYYFISDIVSINNDLWQLSMRCDVLSSYSKDIKKLNALISRNEFKYNNLLNDNNVFLQYVKEVQEEEVDNIIDASENYTVQSGKVINKSTNMIEDSSDPNNKIAVVDIPLNKPNEKRTKYKLSFNNDLGTSNLTYAFYTGSDYSTYVDGSSLESGTYDITIEVPRNANRFVLSFNGSNPIIKYTNIVDFTPNGFKQYPGSTVSGHAMNCVMSTIEYGIDSTWYVNSVLAIPDNNVMNSVGFKSTQAVGYSQPWVMPYQVLQAIASIVISDDTLGSFIVSSIVYPFEIPTYRDASGKLADKKVILGNKHVQVGGTDLVYFQPSMKQSPIIKNAEFIIEGKNDYLNYEPYTKYEIYIPYCSWIEVSAEQVLNKRLQLNYVVNYTDGSASAFLIDTTSNKMIWGGACQLGINIPVSSSNALEISKAKDANSLNMILGLLGSSASVGFGIATANPIAVAGGLMGGVSAVANYVSKDNQMFIKGSCNIGSGNDGLYAPQKVRVRKTISKPIYNDETYASLYGKPLNEYHRIGDMNGYTVIGNVHLENFGSATESEISSIDALLKEGIII